MKMTGHNWADKLQISFVNLDGFNSFKDYNNKLINKNEFLLRAANCVVFGSLQNTRRSISNFKKKLKNGKI